MNLFQNDASAISFAAGQTIFRSGDPSDGQMYAVGEGEVEIQLNGQVLEIIGPGGFFGEMALIDHESRSASAIARTAVRVVPINERRFTFLVQNNPYFPLFVMRKMAERIRRLSPKP